MASIVSAGTTSATALNMSADTSGVLQLAVNNGTVAVTLSTTGQMALGTSAPSAWGNTNKAIELYPAVGAGYVALNNNNLNGGYLYWNMYFDGTGNFCKTTGTSAYFGFTGTGAFGWGAIAGTGGSSVNPTLLMNLTTTGQLTTPLRTQFLATRSGSDQTLTVAPTVLILNSATQNTGSAYNASTGVFTAPVAGTYAFSMSARIDNSTNDGYGRAGFAVNGSNSGWVYGQQIYTISTSTAYVSYNATLIIKLSANDTVSCQWGGSDTSAILGTESAFSGCLIG